jgi:glyoxalase family protein
MEKNIRGLHHITALASDPQRNYDFYTKIIGLRFVKKTVNFDAPDVYHFYFGDEIGTPGTILTFFPFPNAKRGTGGTGEASIVSFSVPKESMDFWMEHLSRYDIRFDGPNNKFDYNFLSFSDPDGMRIELVEDDVEHLLGWETEDLPRKYSVRKFFGTTVCLGSSEKTESLIEKFLGFNRFAESEDLIRYISGEGDREAKFDIRVDKEIGKAMQSAGSVHHIAWRTESDASQDEWLKKLRANGIYTTDVIDRNYFHSIYFREPGGVLFEIATDEPGFMIDEEKENLGNRLMLPGMYESRRDEIEKRLIPIRQTDKMVSVHSEE